MSLKQPLGTIEKVELRDVWPHEARDFTNWLAEDESLSLLGDAIGIDIELVETESQVGSFNADILATESGSDRRIVIENQLEDTNHDHLGKIITYAAGKGAEVIIWVVAHARDEHKQAIEWLNEHTDNDFAFFLVEIEVWKIGDSIAAPRFNVVERPNDWAKAVKLSGELSDVNKLYLQYWQVYEEQALASVEFSRYMKPQRPRPNKASDVSVGTSQYHLTALVSTMHKRIGVQVYVPNNKELVHRIAQEKAQFEEALQMKSELFEGVKAGGIKFFKQNHDIAANRDKWPEYIAWQLDALVKLREVMKAIED